MPAPTPDLVVALGGVPVAFSSPEPAWLDRARTRYGAFETGDVPAFRLEHRLRPGVAPLGRVERTVEARRRGDELLLTAASFDASFDLARGEGWLESGVDLAPLDAVVRALVPFLLRDGLVVHGGALETEDGGGVLFCGASGAGKSTFAALHPGRAACDELAAVRATEDGLVLESLPFWNGRRSSRPLRAVLLLGHARDGRHEARRLTPAAALRGLLPHVLWPEQWPDRVEEALGVVGRLAAETRVVELDFLPRSDVADAVAKALA